MRVYSAPIIYHVEDVHPFSERVAVWVHNPAADLVTSDVARLECRVKPISTGATDLLQLFDSFFRDAEIVDLSSALVDRATEIQARSGFATPDALHLAAAVFSNCDVYLTNDRKLSSFPDLRVELID